MSVARGKLSTSTYELVSDRGGSFCLITTEPTLAIVVAYPYCTTTFTSTGISDVPIYIT